VVKYLGAVLILITCVLLSGCTALIIGGAAAGAAAGGVLYAKGDLEASTEHPYKDVVKAARGAIDDVDLHLIQEKDLDGATVFDCRRTDDKKVIVRITTVTSELTNINIRVGTFGDEDFSRYLYGKIQDRLG
jgi:hypothetical protein